MHQPPSAPQPLRHGCSHARQRVVSLRSQFDLAVIATHAACEPDQARRLRWQHDRCRFAPHKAAVEMRRREDDAIHTVVVVAPMEDEANRHARPGNDRLRPIATVGDDFDDLIVDRAVWIERRRRGHRADPPSFGERSAIGRLAAIMVGRALACPSRRRAWRSASDRPPVAAVALTVVRRRRPSCRRPHGLEGCTGRCAFRAHRTSVSWSASHPAPGLPRPPEGLACVPPGS